MPRAFSTPRKLRTLGTLLLPFAALFFATLAFASDTPEWPQWRGPHGNGTSEGNPPIEWSEEQNVKWKIALPGLGSSTPIVIGKQLVLTLAIDTGKTQDGAPGEADRSGRHPDNVHEWYVVSYDRGDGSELWRTKVSTGLPHEGSHMHATWASSSPITDGEHIFAYFGSVGLFALDLEGKLVWERDFGSMNKRNAFGEGSSPAVYGDRIAVQWDHEGDSFLAVLDKRTGDEVWRKERDEISTWSSPLIVPWPGGAQVITNATTNVKAYDLETGDVIWHTGGMTTNVVPSPVYSDGIAYLMSGFRGYNLLAIGLEGAEGDITGSDSVLWTYDRDTPYVVSPLLYDGTLYFFKVLSPILTALDAKTGETHYGPERLAGFGNVYASPVGAAGRVYLVDRKGVTLVIKAGSELEILATNRLDDGFDASPVIVGNDLYLRGHESLYCLAEE